MSQISSEVSKNLTILNYWIWKAMYPTVKFILEVILMSLQDNFNVSCFVTCKGIKYCDVFRFLLMAYPRPGMIKLYLLVSFYNKSTDG